jgi:hypothetical protein
MYLLHNFIGYVFLPCFGLIQGVSLYFKGQNVQ